MAKFDPNRLTFEQGIDRIKEASARAGFKLGKKIVTSRDKPAIKAVNALEVKNVPEGFKKFQLPVFFSCATQTYLSFAAPGVKVPEHSHHDGPGIRVIISGSIKFSGKELSEGDWMYIPAGAKYTFEVGPRGVGMFYCY